MLRVFFVNRLYLLADYLFMLIQHVLMSSYNKTAKVGFIYMFTLLISINSAKFIE